MEAPYLALISVAGVVNAWLLGAVILFNRESRRSPGSVRLALFLLAAGYLLGTFTFWYFDWLSYTVATRVVHDAMVLFAGALFLDHIVCATGRDPLHPVAYVPGAIYLVAGTAIGGALIERISIGHLVSAQMVYTIAATVVALRTDARGRSGWRWSAVAGPLIALWLLHSVQVLRMLLPRNQLVFDLVPLVGALMLIAFNVYVLGHSRVLARMAPGPTGASVSVPVSLSDLEDYLVRERPFLNPKLTADELAGALGITSRQLSTLLNRDAGRTFYEFLQQYRIAEAKRLLSSTAERRTSVEAIGLMAGFRSRSTFYEAFRRDTGSSPARFRRDGIGRAVR